MPDDRPVMLRQELRQERARYWQATTRVEDGQACVHVAPVDDSRRHNVNDNARGCWCMPAPMWDADVRVTLNGVDQAVTVWLHHANDGRTLEPAQLETILKAG